MASEAARKADHDPERMTRGARRGFVVLALAMLATGAGSVIASVAYASMAAHRQDAAGRQQDKVIARLDAQGRRQDATIAQLRRQLLAACNAAADLGTVPLPAKPPPSRFAVRIVTDNRAQWYGLGCGLPGSLPVPAGLAAAAARYGIPADGKARS